MKLKLQAAFDSVAYKNVRWDVEIWEEEAEGSENEPKKLGTRIDGADGDNQEEAKAKEEE